MRNLIKYLLDLGQAHVIVMLLFPHIAHKTAQIASPCDDERAHVGQLYTPNPIVDNRFGNIRVGNERHFCSAVQLHVPCYQLPSS